MAEIKKISTEFQLLNKFLDTSGDAGSANQVLVSTATGVDWVDGSGSGIIGGPYLPLSAGTSYPLTGDLYVGTSTAGTDRFIRAYYSDSSYTEVRGYGIIANRTTVSYYRPVNDKTQILAIGNDGNTWNYISQNANYHTFGKDTSEWMRIDTSGNVGIGTTSPGGKLDIAYTGTGGTGTFGIGEGLNIYSLSPNITFNDNSSGVDNYSIHLNQNVFTLGRYTSATSQSPDLVLANGNVGIGLTNPADRLDLYDSDDNVGMYFHTATSGTGYGSGLRVGQNNTNAFVWNYEATPLSLATSGTARLTINATGGIRFNTGYGAGTLVTDASGNITVSSGGGAGGPYLPLSAGSSYPLTGDLYIEGADKALRINNGTQPVVYLGDGGANTDGQLILYSSAGAANVVFSGDNQNHYIANGNVGIGTTSPTQKLEVIGRTKITQSGDALRINSSDANGSYATWENNDSNIGYIGAGYHLWSSPNNIATSLGIRAQTRLDLGIQASVHMTILNTGNVGIGTTSPSAKLEVNDSANNIQMRLGSLTAGISPILRLQGKNSANTSNYYADIELDAENGKLIFNDPGTSGSSVGQNPMVLDSSGKVGIGTDSPNSLLHVYGGAGNDVIARFKTTGTGASDYSEIHIANNNDDELVLGSIGSNYTGSNWAGMRYVYATSGDLGLKAISGDGNVRIYAGSTSLERMRINSSGNVGIGTTSPAQRMVISGESIYPILNATSVSSASLLISNSDTAYGTYIASRSDGSGIIQQRRQTSATYYALSLNPYGGNVGIGTVSPGAKLHLSGISQTGSQDVFRIENDTSNTKLQIKSVSGDYNLQFKNAGNTTRVFLNSNGDSYLNGGNVGIGTTSPSEKLEVDGNVKADSFIKDGGTSSQYLMADGSVSASGGTSPWVATTSPTGIKYTAGKVGIGTDPNSQQDLAVGSNGIITGAIKSTGQSRLDGLVYCASEVEFSDTIKLGGMTTTQINAISSPSAGLTIYNTTLNTICFYNGSNWQKVTSTTM